MSLLDKASLIVTPNAYEESKLYSVIPNTTLGDMDVVRATTATRVNSAGLIEVVPRNLFTNSEQIDTADWARQGVSATANQAISPNGTLTAELLDDGTAASTQHWIFQNPSLLNGTTYTISFYAKYISRKFMAVNIFNGLASQYVYYNIQDGLVSGSTGDVTASITSVGNGWFRIVYTRPMATSGSSPNFRIALADDTSNITYTGSNKQAYVWGFQLENFATATEYFPTTTRLNIPRIDYTNGSCPSILVEPQRTNLLLYSNDFSNANWAKVASSTVTTDSGVQNPSGVSPTFRFNASNLAFGGILRQILILTVGQTYTFSYFAKKGNYRYVGIRFNNARNGERFPTYDFDTDTLNKQGATCDLSRTLLTNGWVKLTITFNATIITSNCDIALTTSNGDTSTALSGTEFVYVYGAQTELGTYGTSYIPTVASTVTRNADVISKTGISSLIGQTEGTVFVELYNQLIDSTIIFLNKNNTNSIVIQTTPTNIIARCYANSVSILLIAGVFTVKNEKLKVAIKYSSAGAKIFVNGILKATNVNPVVFTAAITEINFNDGVILNLNQTIYNNGVQLYKTALTDTECITLTTL